MKALAFTALVLLAGCATTRGPLHAAPGVEVFTFTRDFTNVHVLVSGNRMLMVDAGYARNAVGLENDLVNAGLDPRNLKAVVVTHGHADHAGGARHFQQRFGARVVVGKGDEHMVATGVNDPICPTDAVARFREKGDVEETYTPTTPDLVVSDHVDLALLLGVPARVVRLPGHTEGSLVVMAGDTTMVGDLFRGEMVGPGATRHFYMCNLDDNRDDVRLLVHTLAPGSQTFLTGHFGPVTRDDVLAMLKRWYP